MASEIRVDKINSLSGVGTVTLSPTGVDISGITTAATLRATTGIVTSLTAGSLTSLGAVSGTTGTFTGNVAVSGANITLQDSGSASDDRIALGAGGDLQLFHDGSNSYVRETGTGSLFLEGNSTIYIGKASGGAENGIVYNVDGSADLYHNNSKKFETTNTGATVTGVLISDGLDVGDNEYLRLGTGNDFVIGHAETSSFLRNDTGELYIRSDGIRIVNQGNDETYIKCVDDGAVELYHNNSKKIETSSSGITISGDNSTGSYIKGVTRFTPNDSTTVKVMWDEGGFSGAGHFQVKDGVAFTAGDSSDLKIYHDGSSTSHVAEGTGNLRISVAGGSNQIQLTKGTAPTENIAKFIADGAVELYHNNTKKFETTTDGVTVTGEVVSGTLHCSGKLDMPDSSGATVGRVLLGDSDDLSIYHNGSHSYIEESGTGNLYIRSSNTRMQSSAGEDQILMTEDGSVELYHNGTKMVETTSTGTSIPDGKFAKFGASDDMSMGHNTYNYITYTGADLLITGDATNQIKLMPKSDEPAIICKPNAEVELYYDNGKRFQTSSNGVTVYSNHSAYSYLNLRNTGDVDIGYVQGWSDGTNHEMGFSHSSTSGGWAIRCDFSNSGATRVYMFVDLWPSASNTWNLGSSSSRWGTLYASNATNTSDRNLKNTIKESDLGLDFICKLKPVSYKWNQKEAENLDTKTHYGLISQDVEEAVIETGKTLDDFGAIDKPDGDPMSLSYNEFISPLIKAVQELSAENTALKARLDAAGL